MSSRQGTPRRHNQSPTTPFWTPRTSFSQSPKPEWNAKPQMSNTNKVILTGELARLESNRARELVLDPEFVTFIYNHVKTVALWAGPNNFSALGYNVEMITIVGGTVLTLYDQILGKIKNAYEINHLKRYVERDTLDIDAVWCLPEYVPFIAFNDGVLPFVDAFITLFNGKKPAVLPHQITNMRCEKDIKGLKFGTIHLKVFCTIDAVEYEIFDLAIHDSRSSQRFNEDYTQITETQRTTQDPIYSSLQNTILLPFGASGIRVPRMDVFIRQQLFAFGNVILHMQGDIYIKGGLRPRSDKGYIHLRRVLYILHILSRIHPNNAASMHFFAGMQIYPMYYIQYIHEGIERRRQAILHKLPQKDKEVFNKKMDMILREFDLPRSVSHKPAPLQVHSSRTHSSSRRSPHDLVQHHVAMDALASSVSSGTFENIIDAIHTIIMTNKSLIGTFKRSNPSLDIKYFFDNIGMYKGYSDKKMPNDQIKKAMTDIIKEEKIEKIKNHVKPLPEQKQLVKLVDILVSRLKTAIVTSGGRRRTQKKRRTRKR
jgi:hypothetical protein